MAVGSVRRDVISSLRNSCLVKDFFVLLHFQQLEKWLNFYWLLKQAMLIVFIDKSLLFTFSALVFHTKFFLKNRRRCFANSIYFSRIKSFEGFMIKVV